MQLQGSIAAIKLLYSPLDPAVRMAVRMAGQRVLTRDRQWLCPSDCSWIREVTKHKRAVKELPFIWGLLTCLLTCNRARLCALCLVSAPVPLLWRPVSNTAVNTRSVLLTSQWFRGNKTNAPTLERDLCYSRRSSKQSPVDATGNIYTKALVQRCFMLQYLHLFMWSRQFDIVRFVSSLFPLLEKTIAISRLCLTVKRRYVCLFNQQKKRCNKLFLLMG